jgi:hypothetical protein
MARAGPIVRGPARFGSYRKPLLVFPYLPPEQHGALRPRQLWRLSQAILRVPHHFSDAVKSGSGPPQREGGRWQVGIGVLRSTRLRAAGGLGTERTGLGTEQ